MKLDSHLMLCTKINSKRILELNVKVGTIKLQQVNMVEYFFFDFLKKLSLLTKGVYLFIFKTSLLEYNCFTMVC